MNHKIQGKLLFISSDLSNRNMTAELYYTTVPGYSTIRYEFLLILFNHDRQLYSQLSSFEEFVH